MKNTSSSKSALKKKHQLISISIKNFLKSSSAAFLVTICAILCIFPILNKTKVSENWTTFAAIASAIATVVICLYTVRSVIEVIKSNKETAENNHNRDSKETFEKNFSSLLQEHNRYLEKITSVNNKFYDINHLQQCSGYESYDIVRGQAKFATIDGFRFLLQNDVIFIRVSQLRHIKTNKLIHTPVSDANEYSEYETLYFEHELYSSGELTYYYFPYPDRFILAEDFLYISNQTDNYKIIKKLLNTKGTKAKEVIIKNNKISKNLLSPYMRIVYHLLKCSSENTTDKLEMKKYTNIVRSIIPYDILMLIAINAMFFYKSFDESRNELTRWSDYFNASVKNPYNGIFNDYHKYYQLLIKCDFFEHLNMNFPQVISKMTKLELSVDLSFLKTFTFNSTRKISSTGKNKYFLLIDEDPEYGVIRLYKAFHQKTMTLHTDILILIFYIEDTKIERIKLKIMDDIILNNRKDNIEFKFKLKCELYNLNYSDSTIIEEDGSRFFLARDFFELYSKGRLPAVI